MEVAEGVAQAQTQEAAHQETQDATQVEVDEACSSSTVWQRLMCGGDEEKVARKRRVAPLGALGLLFCLAYIVEAAITGEYPMLGVFAALMVFGCIAPVAYIAFKDCPQLLFEGQLVLFLTAIIGADLYHSGMFDEWLYSLLLLDVACGTHSRVGHVVTALTCLWIVIKTIEEAYDVGIYAAGRDHSDEVGKGTRFFVHALCVRCVIVLSHYYCKQQLADALRGRSSECNRMVTSLEALSKAMSRYSLNEITDAAKQAKGTGIEFAMEELRLMLTHYRPYISEALFVGPEATKGDKTMKCLHTQSLQRQSTFCETIDGNRVSVTTTDSIGHQNSGMWTALEQLERDRASSITKGIRRGSSLAIEGIPFMVGSRSYLKKMVATSHITLESVIEDLPDELVGNVSMGFLETVFDCVTAQSGIIHCFDASSASATFIRAPSACRCALSIRTRLGTFLKQYGNMGQNQGALYIGLAFGPVFFGNVGVPSRLVYTAFGNGVSTAIKVAALNTQVGSTILCTSDVHFRSKNEITLTPITLPVEEQYFQVEEDISGTSGFNTLFRSSSFCKRNSTRGDPLCADERSRRILGRKEPDWEGKGNEHRPSIQSIQNLIDESEDKPVRNPLTASRPLLKPLRSMSLVPETRLDDELVDSFLQRIMHHQTSVSEVLSFSREHQTRFVRTVMPSLSAEAVEYIVATLASMRGPAMVPADFVAFSEQPVSDRVSPLGP